MEKPAEGVGITIAELCRQYHVNMAHAEHVGMLSRDLFEISGPLHNFDARYGEVIYVAGLLHNVAYAGGVRKHHTRGRDILLNTPLDDLDDDDRELVAVTTAFHRKRWKDSRLDDEPSHVALSPERRRIAQWLSALVRVADGLDYSHSQATIISASEADKEGVRVTVSGPYAYIDAPRADKKADMWRAVTGIPARVLEAGTE